MNCKNCVYEPKCGTKPTEEAGCVDFKDKDLFVELPFMIHQIVYYIEPATKYVPVVFDGEAYFKLVDDSKVKSHLFSAEELESYLLNNPFMVKKVKEYFATREEAEKALAERVKKNG